MQEKLKQIYLNTLEQSEPKRNGNNEILHIPQISRIGTSPSDAA